MNEMLKEAHSKMQQTKCECGSTKIEINFQNFRAECAECGAIIEQSLMVNPSTSKGPSGELEKQGRTHDMRKPILNFDMDAPGFTAANNIRKRENKIRTKLQHIVSQLDGDCPQFPLAIDRAIRLWKLCFEKKLTRGYDGNHMAAILFYMACREMTPQLPYLLLDFAAICEINVYKLASKFQKLCRDIPIVINSLTDPSIYIARFAGMLEFGEDLESVSCTACKLVDQMKADWITTGRRPSGVCGAAILIAARMHGFKRSIKEIVNVVQLSEGTIKKRVNEFLDTKCASMTVDTFKSIGRDEMNENAKGRTEEMKELPPVMKEEQRRLGKVAKEEEMRVKKMEEIEKFETENGIVRDESKFEMKSEGNVSDSDECDFDDLMRPVTFVKATQSEISEKTQSQSKSPPLTSHTHTNTNSSTNDKREMDASDEEEEVELDLEVRNGSTNKENVNNNIVYGNGNGVEFERSSMESAQSVAQEMRNEISEASTYITAATRSDLVPEDFDGSDVDIDIEGGTAFIVGANATQLDEYRDEKEDKHEKWRRETDLSEYDNDPEVMNMIITPEEARAKNQIFMIINPDWVKVKKDMDRRAMKKEENERKNKRNLGSVYKQDPNGYITGKMKKRFRSDRINIDAFNRLIGNEEQSPEINIKKQDPLG